jgi:hypothetical protein
MAPPSVKEEEKRSFPQIYAASGGEKFKVAAAELLGEK